VNKNNGTDSKDNLDIVVEEQEEEFLYSTETDSNSEEKNINISSKDFEEDRYHRLRLIPWWDQKKLQNSRVMVVGAGALGNEIVKNLALLGVGTILIVDFDIIESSNLSRSILFRAGDEGRNKAEVAARRAKEINPDIKAIAMTSNVVYDIGLGLYKYMDVIIGGLDNREARLSINQSCWKVNRPWIDGAIEVLHGVAKVFIPPDGACYECTLNELDYKLLNMRKSCALLTKDDLLLGKIPTTPTISSIIAGIQVQEAVKIIHKRPEIPALKGRGIFFNGQNFDSYVIKYQRKEECLSHETYKNIIELDKSTTSTTLSEALDLVRKYLGKDAILEFDKDILLEFICNKCQKKERVLKSLGRTSIKEAKCPLCGEERIPEIIHSVSGDEDFLDLTLNQIGIPLWEILTGRREMDMVYLEFSADKELILGKK